jgi:hypothetical protein
MVEFALARLLRRAGPLTGSGLPRDPAPTLGAVQVRNVLPHQLGAHLSEALTQSKAGGDLFKAPMPPGQLVLPKGVRWEFEHLAPA